MKNLFKYSMAAVAAMALAGSAYAIPTVVITDGAGINVLQVSGTGVILASGSDTNWSVVATISTSWPPALGQGSASSPVMDLSITATYLGQANATGNPLIISFGADGFGPTTGNVIATLTGHVISGTGNSITFSNLAAAGSVLPTLGSPVIAGTTLTSAVIPNGALGYSSSVAGGPLNLSSYSLDEVVVLTGNPGGSSYSIDASLVTVPDGGMTLVLLGSALSGLALIKRKLA